MASKIFTDVYPQNADPVSDVVFPLCAAAVIGSIAFLIEWAIPLPRGMFLPISTMLFALIGWCVGWVDTPWYSPLLPLPILLAACLGAYHLRYEAQWREVLIVGVILVFVFSMGLFQAMRAARKNPAP